MSIKTQIRGRSTDKSARTFSLAWKVVSCLAILVALTNFFTYNILADGDWSLYRGHIIASTCFGLLGSTMMMMQTNLRSLMTPTVLLTCTLVPGIMHGLRLSNPYINGKPITEASASKSFPGSWIDKWDFLELDEDSISLGSDGALELTIRPRRSASVRAKRSLPRQIPRWQMPLGLNRGVMEEEIDVTLSTELTDSYLGVIHSNRARIQVVPYGIKLTLPDDRGDVGSVDIPVMAWSDHAPHRWQLFGTGTLLTFKLDGLILWAGQQHEKLEPVLIGDAQSDSEHGGLLNIQSARFVRYLSLRSD